MNAISFLVNVSIPFTEYTTQVSPTNISSPLIGETADKDRHSSFSVRQLPAKSAFEYWTNVKHRHERKQPDNLRRPTCLQIPHQHVHTDLCDTNIYLSNFTSTSSSYPPECTVKRMHSQILRQNIFQPRYDASTKLTATLYKTYAFYRSLYSTNPFQIYEQPIQCQRGSVYYRVPHHPYSRGWSESQTLKSPGLSDISRSSPLQSAIPSTASPDKPTGSRICSLRSSSVCAS